MRIHEGKRYVRRDGTITQPMEPYMQDLIGYAVVFDPETLWRYNNSEHGGNVYGRSTREHEKDLIEEYNESWSKSNG